MPPWPKLTLSILSLVAVAALVLAFTGKEPRYHGRELSQWLEGYGADFDTPERHRRTEEAVLHIGTNGLPLLVRWLSYEEPVPISKLWQTVARLPIIGDHLNWLSGVHKQNLAGRAALAFATLGRTAESAIPDLTKILNQTSGGDSRARAAFALGNIGPRGLPPLLFVLTNQQAPKAQATAFAAWSISYLGTNARPAVPYLVTLLRDASPAIVRASIYSLGELNLEPDTVLPALQPFLGHPTKWLNSEAALALSKFGTQAVAAVPALRTNLQDSSDIVRCAATNALLKIAPEVLTNKIY